MKKIAIITELFESTNYGGVLQAYALCRVIEQMGYVVKQIPYYEGFSEDKESIIDRTDINVKAMIVRRIRAVLDRRLQIKFEKFREFRECTIPCENKVYDDSSLVELIDFYDVFITGSDQVWNPDFFRKGYLLSFVPSNYVKLSYAASLGCSSLTDKQKSVFLENINDYRAISVREQEAVDLLQPLTNTPVELVLDPIFLLNKKEWGKIESNRKIDGKYIFVYFLGSSKEQRNLVKKFAKKKRMKIVFMPYTLDFFRKCDAFFGDIRLFDVSPKEFISLIRNAEYVFTDSFHASAFSIMYHRQFFAFGRNSFGNTESRISNLTKLFECQEHFCDDNNKMQLTYIESLPQIVYKNRYDKFEKLKEKSLEYLIRNIT